MHIYRKFNLHDYINWSRKNKLAKRREESNEEELRGKEDKFKSGRKRKIKKWISKERIKNWAAVMNEI
jgi:hypothetical protein